MIAGGNLSYGSGTGRMPHVVFADLTGQMGIVTRTDAFDGRLWSAAWAEISVAQETRCMIAQMIKRQGSTQPGLWRSQVLRLSGECTAAPNGQGTGAGCSGVRAVEHALYPLPMGGSRGRLPAGSWLDCRPCVVAGYITATGSIAPYSSIVDMVQAQPLGRLHRIARL
jgi:hypothetical protein